MSEETRGHAGDGGNSAATMTAEEFKEWMARTGFTNYGEAGAALGYTGEAVRSWVGKGRSGVPKVVALLCRSLERIRKLEAMAPAVITATLSPDELAELAQDKPAPLMAPESAAQVQQVSRVVVEIEGLDPAALSKGFMAAFRRYSPIAAMHINPENVRLALVDALEDAAR